MNEIIKEQPKRQYKIVNHLMMSKLEEEVNDLLNDGWDLVGPAAFCMGGQPPHYFQTLTKGIHIADLLGITSETDTER